MKVNNLSATLELKKEKDGVLYVYKKIPPHSSVFINLENLSLITPLVKDISIPSEFLLNNTHYFKSVYKSNLVELSNIEKKQREDCIAKVLTTIKKIHSIEWDDLDISKFLLDKRLDFFRSLVKNKRVLNILSNNHEIAKKWAITFQKNHPEQSISHNDLVSGNILFDDEMKLYIIDFDMATLNHPLFDYISFLYENNFSKKEHDYIMNHIINEFHNLDRSHFKLMKIYQCTLWSYWASYYFEKTNNQIYLSILKSKLRLLSISDFDLLY